MDRSALRLGELFTGSVPVIGQALSDTAEVFLTGMGLLKSSLGLAALMVIGAEFLPLYVQLMLHLAFLTVCSLLCGLSGEQPLSGAVRLYGRSCKMHGCHYSIVF